MAEGFELYHVPQQSRRDKLRISAAPNSFHPTLAGAGLLPFYDPSFDLAAFQTTQNPNPQFLYPSQPSSSSAGELALYRPAPAPEPLLSRQGLSLSLSSNTQLPVGLNFQYSAPPGPFTGYTSVLKTSMFLRPAQLLLQEACDVAGICSGGRTEPDLNLLDPPLDNIGLSDCDVADNQRKCRLISMLDEVYRRYKQYYQQMQAVVASFGSIPGLNNAAPFANFALKSLSKHFKCLKAAIVDQLQFVGRSTGSLSGQKHGQSDENDKFALYSHRAIHNGARALDNQPVWRPQRGLPERAVSVLRSWLFEHFLHPYPTDTDKMMLAKQTGLTRSQVSNWFINARVRLWKPMVEEIHALETRQQAHHNASASSSQTNKDHFVEPLSSLAPDQARSSPFPPEKRVRNDLSDLPLPVHHHYGQFSAGSFPNPPGASAGVSLTLALHQNGNMSGLLDPFPPVGLAQRYGLPAQVDGGFEGQNRHFSSRDVMGGQMLHDFVG